MHILKQLASIGLLNERLYQMPEDDSQDDHTTVDQAKIDPNVAQNVSTDPNPQEDTSDEADTDDDKPEPEVEDDETAEPDAGITIDAARSLAALHAALHATQVLADLVYTAKDELISKLGDESAPALHEVLFKVKTAFETLTKMIEDVKAKPVEDEPEPEADDQTDQTDTEQTEPSADAVTPPTEKKPEDAESYAA